MHPTYGFHELDSERCGSISCKTKLDLENAEHKDGLSVFFHVALCFVLSLLIMPLNQAANHRPLQFVKIK